MVARVILPDCCEDWILELGAFYRDGAGFNCVECGSGWRKLGAGRYQHAGTGKVWLRRAWSSEGEEFPYLEAADGEHPVNRRCCAKLILRFDERIRAPREFSCPMCGTAWQKTRMPHRSGIEVTGYVNTSEGVTMAVQNGPGRNYLVPIDEYTVWGDR